MEKSKRKPKEVVRRPFPNIPKNYEDLEKQSVDIRTEIENTIDEQKKELLQKIFLERRSLAKYLS